MWFLLWGAKTGNDTDFYVNGAQSLLEEGFGYYDDFRMYLKTTYMLFLGAHLNFSDELLWVIFSQAVLHIGSAVLLWSVIRNYCRDFSALILVIAYSFFPVLARWNFYILTESMAISASVVVVWLVWKLETSDKFNLIPFLPVLLMIALIRPHLAAIVLGFIIFYIVRKISIHRFRLREILAASSVVGGLLIFIFPDAEVLSKIATRFTEFYSRGIILGEWWRIDTGNLSEMSVWQKTMLFSKLMFWRVVSELGMIRPYYSLINNFHLVLYATAIYALCIIGIARANYFWTKMGMLSAIVANYALISLTLASWDGRFAMYVMPQIWALAAMGVGVVEKKVCNCSAPGARLLRSNR